MEIAPFGLTISDVTHHQITVNGTRLHYVSAGNAGSPILLVHGFPESWWTFHKLIPLLAARHRVYALDLRGFGDSESQTDPADSATLAEDLSGLVDALGVGPVHLVAQDISGATAVRLAMKHPEQLLSFTAIEMGLPGYGLEGFADVTRGGTWYIGVLAAPGIADMLLAGREEAFLGQFAFPSMCANSAAFSEADIAEFVRVYSRAHGWTGAVGLYQSMLKEGQEIRELAGTNKLAMPVLAIGAGGGEFTAGTMMQVVEPGRVSSELLQGVGHYAAMEAPDAVADALLKFADMVDEEVAV
jgi:pimeloyl-ACP methyl ester carboxylesterase